MIDWFKRFLERAKEVHGNKYDYSKVEYVNSKTKVCIICPEHGEFWQEPVAHLRGYNCPKCANIKRGDTFRDNLCSFVEKSKEVHGDRYDYSKVEYKNSSTKVCIICPEHGEFYMLPQNHILGQGCPKCAGKWLNTYDIIKKFKEVHGNKYDYSKVDYKKMHEKVCIICPEHGEFWQTPSKHLLGQDCPKCAKISMGEKNNMGGEEFIKRSIEKWGNLYDYSKVEYEKVDKKVEIICKKHGSFFQRPYDHLHGHGCPVCGKLESKSEIELYDLICEMVGKENVIHNDRKTLNGKEIDIFVPSYNIGIEFNGLRWHSEIYLKDRYYHINKSIEAYKKGIRLIHIFEDEWADKKEIVKSRLKNIFGITEHKIFARKCEIKEINNTISKKFLEENHIQGNVYGKVNIGLFYNDELVSLMTFGNIRKNLGSKKIDGKYELLRFCNKLDTIVVGGASKLFKFFIKKYQPDTILSYCDLRWSDGNLYRRLGFVLDHISKPNYFYIKNLKRLNRFNFRKDILIKEGYNSKKTEHEIMLERKIYRIYDCGCGVYVYNNEKH